MTDLEDVIVENFLSGEERALMREFYLDLIQDRDALRNQVNQERNLIEQMGKVASIANENWRMKCLGLADALNARWEEVEKLQAENAHLREALEKGIGIMSSDELKGEA